ncbi:extracellular metalloprotease [Fusarium albosuccineum]|uniref:Extracellular metalloprotease n=1 Tax=Fusarium albosuccineum TaxID=1237068 RepID=A0A8H4P235_9HYPO|nr:extracellular metalloprotease [Fusarium albosuccineum]
MCSFIPRTLFQRIVDDETASEHARNEAQQQINAITSTLSAAASSTLPESSVKVRYDDIPNGFKEFSSKIWGMSGRNIEEINYETGEVLGTSYKPLPRIFYSSSSDPPYKDDQDVITCMEGLRTTYDFYKTVFRRNSVDNKGLQLEASIHYSIRYGNAIWVPQARQMVFGDGDGNSRFGRFAGVFKPGSMVNSLDVIAHELTHGVTQHTAGFEYQGQSGALDESVADVFGSMVLQWKQGQTVHEASWLLGADIIYENSESLTGDMAKATSLRSLKDPSATSNMDPQPDNMPHKLYYTGQQDNGGVHCNSGVPNHAFYKVAMELGGHSWDRAGKIWYATLTDSRMHPLTTFLEFARVTVDQAKILYPDDMSIAEVVAKAWKDVGVL